VGSCLGVVRRRSFWSSGSIYDEEMPKFVRRQRKHKVRQREAATDNVSANTNQIQLLPQNRSERDEKRRKLKEELRAGQEKISGKKQKRLDKYIETKLKKDENLELLRKLSQGKFDTSRLRSSKHLGKRDFADFIGEDSFRKRHVGQVGHDIAQDPADSDVDSEDSFEREHPDTVVAAVRDPLAATDGHGVAVSKTGSGLKQPLVLGADGLPILQVRKKKRIKSPAPEPDELPWEGFDSESEQMPENSAELLEEEEDIEGGSIDADQTDSSSEREEDDNGPDTSGVPGGRLKPRDSAFKAWATQQINRALDYTPQHLVDVSSEVIAPGKPTVGQQVTPLTTPPPDSVPMSSRIVYSVNVSRSPIVQNARLSLPILAEEQKIMEAIHSNPVTIIWGATGSGKTTQVPQFLFEAGYGDAAGPTPGMIGITQPRRVAAVSMARRVAEELGEHSEKVSYQIRFDSTTSSQTAIKFMTDGILLREVSQDISLKKYSVIVIDEAHERSVNTDILVGMLSRIVEQRAKPDVEDGIIRPLKLVIMSATLRVSDFLQNDNLFRSGVPPFVQAEGRQYPVTVHFSRRTHRDYVEEAFRKVVKAHHKLPHGGILVFLTGQNEIKALFNRLQKALSPSTTSTASVRVQVAASEAPLETEDLELGIDQQQDAEDASDLEIVTEGDRGDDEDHEFDIDEESPNSTSNVHLLPLYSQLPTKEQLRVFDVPPPGSRLIVLATNVAETSLTIPGIRYVFDCGRSKERVYDPTTGVQSFEVGWISKASAEQRKGRAGRTGPGHCYRLYSSAVYERDFAEHADPEILRTPLESIVLQLKSMGIDRVARFPFPTPPDRQSLVKAEKLLRNLGALSESGQVTPLGRSLSNYPLSPRFGKMLSLGNQHDCMPYVVALVAGLAVGDLFIPENQVDMTPARRQADEVYSQADQERDTQREQRRKRYNETRAAFSKHDRTSDALKMLTAVCAYAWEESDAWCEEHFVRAKAMKEVMQLRQQLTSIVRLSNPAASLTRFEPRLAPANSKQLKALNQIVTAGFIDQVAIRADCSPNPPDMARRPKRAIDVPYLPLVPLEREDAVYLHPSSVLAHTAPGKLPKYIVYSHLQQSVAPQVGGGSTKIRMFPLTTTGDLQLGALARGSPLLTYGKPIGRIESLGGFPERRECVVVPALVGRAGSVGWPLTAQKVVQAKDARVGWVIEKLLS
jgi:ATP-dependent RNA helicase DHX37/DHR1